MPKKTKKLTAVKATKGQEMEYRKELNKLGRELIKAINNEVLPFLKSNEEEYVLDGISRQLSSIFRKLNERFTGNIVASFSKSTASKIINKLSLTNRERFNKSLANATGVDLGNILSEGDLDEFVNSSIEKNVSLIKTLPEEYLKQVEVIVRNGLTNGDRYSTIAKQIQSRVGSANSKLSNRIKTIATNEMQTINAQLTLRRSSKLGITKGIYRTVEDERVRPCHKELNGVIYELNKGAWSKTCQKYIQPGITDINCRCTYSPIFEEKDA